MPLGRLVSAARHGCHYGSHYLPHPPGETIAGTGDVKGCAMATAAKAWKQVPQVDPFPKPDPAPAAGCDVCAALAVQRLEAYKVRDHSAVTDSNVEIRQHPHPQRAAR